MVSLHKWGPESYFNETQRISRTNSDGLLWDPDFRSPMLSVFRSAPLKQHCHSPSFTGGEGGGRGGNGPCRSWSRPILPGPWPQRRLDFCTACRRSGLVSKGLEPPNGEFPLAQTGLPLNQPKQGYPQQKTPSRPPSKLGKPLVLAWKLETTVVETSICWASLQVEQITVQTSALLHL